MRERRGRRSGYTLIEILVVLAIVSIVAVIAAIALTNAMDKVRQRETMADMRAVAAAIQEYVSDHGAPPPANGAFAELIGVLSLGDPDSLPLTDHWGHGYRYLTDDRGSYSLESFGKDGVPGADVTLGTRFEFDLDIVLSDGHFVAAPE